MPDYRKAFELAIATDPYDSTSRLAFSDWLEENGFDDEALEQRRKAGVEWVEADKYLHDFLERLTPAESYGRYYEEEKADMPEGYWDAKYTYEEFLAKIEHCLETGDSFYLNFDTPDFVREERQYLIVCYRIVTGKPELDEGEEISFRCGC